MHLIHLFFDVHQALHGQGGRAVEIDGVSHAAHCKILDMRRFRTENGHHLIDLALIFQGLKIVYSGNEVYIRFKLHGWMAPVATGKGSKLAGLNKFFQLVLHLFKFLIAVIFPR